MKIIEALKNLKTIEKRVAKNCEQIKQYAAWVSGETLPFETEDAQRAQIVGLVQSNLDLEKEYLRLKKAIEATNLATTVTVSTQSYPISDLVTLKRNSKAGRDFRALTYRSLDSYQASMRLQGVYSKGIDASNPPKVIQGYKEEDKNKALREWEEFIDAVDGKLEVVNAETDIIGY